MKTKPIEVWKEYQKLKEYCTSKHLFTTVQRNEDFFIGNQWQDLEDNDMPQPVVNLLQRIGKYQIATLSTNDVSINMQPFSSLEDDLNKMRVISKQVEKAIEVARTKEQSRLCIRDAFVGGSSYILAQFDASIETGQAIQGRVTTKVIDCTNVFFGNPYTNDIQEQPYIIIAFRQHLSQVREEAKLMGVKQDDIDSIMPDNDQQQTNDDSDNLVTTLIKYFRKDREIHFTKVTHNVTLIKDTNLGYKRYPLACFGWDQIKNSYLYTSPMTSNIVNQIFINKGFALAQLFTLQNAFPKIVYDANKVDIDEFMNSSSPIAVAGIDSLGKILDFHKTPDFSNQAIPLIQEMETQMKDSMGVSDASLGNVKPDNTSAIIALQESSNVPLELQRQNYFMFWEDIVRNFIDIMSCDYGQRTCIYEGTIAQINFDELRDLNYELNVDIGSGAQYSEIAQINTADKLFQAGVISAETYVEIIPDKYILQKGKVLENVREQMQQQMLSPIVK